MPMEMKASRGVRIICFRYEMRVGHEVTRERTYLEQQERNNSRRLCSHSLGKVERPQQRRSVKESGVEGENRKDVDLRNSHHLGGVEEVPVAELMR